MAQSHFGLVTHPAKIFTIGYEATTMADFLSALKVAGVERVIDVRALPLSRRPGFSKTSLAASLREAGFDYVHLKALGTPKRGRDAAKKGDVATLTAVYDEQLELPEAQAQAAIMLGLAAEKPSALGPRSWICLPEDGTAFIAVSFVAEHAPKSVTPAKAGVFLFGARHLPREIPQLSLG